MFWPFFANVSGHLAQCCGLFSFRLTSPCSAIKVNNEYVSSNFKIKNPYLGTIELLDTQEGESKQIEISVEYKKSYPSTYTFQGKDNYDEIDYINGEDFELTDIPIQYLGINHIRIYNNKL